jgi:general secretion pathway protein N
MQSPWSDPERPSPLRRRLAIGMAALAAAALVVLVEAPASLAGAAVRSWSGARVRLDDAAGTLWNGQADVVLSSGDASGDATSQSATRLPGRLAWRLSPWRLLLGTVDLGLVDPAVLDLPLNLRLDRSANATIDPNRLRLPAGVLLGLGAPWNTILPGGELQLGWDTLHLQDGALRGPLRAEWIDASSRLSPVVPFGHYRLLANGVFDGAVLQLETVSGPMEMSGNGTITGGKQLRFQGTARVQAGTDAATATQLSGLISLLGRRDGDGAILNFGT